MKILMCNSFHYMRGGAERCFLELSALLRAHGHEVIPFSMQDERNLPSEYDEYFVSHIDFPSTLKRGGLGSKWRVAERTIYSREAARKIDALIRATRPDVAHIHGIAHETSPSILPVIKRAGIPIVQTLHDYKLLCPNTSFVSQGKICERCKGHHYHNVVRYRCKRDSLAASLLAGLEMSIHKGLQIYEKNVDLFLTPSVFLHDKVLEYGIKTPVASLPNFIDVGNFQPDYEPEDHFVFAGRLVRLKGVSTLLEAMSQVHHSRLYIAGDGEQRAELEALVAEKGLNNVTFLGHLGTAELISLIRKAKFTVVPSEWYENYSMAVLEAFACGTPVIGASIGGIPEQVRDRITGRLFESGNAEDLASKLNETLADPLHAVEMGRNARRQVEMINGPNLHYKKTIAAYGWLTGGNRAISMLEHTFQRLEKETEDESALLVK